MYAKWGISDIKLQTVCDCVPLYSTVVFNECSYRGAAKNNEKQFFYQRSDVMETKIQLWSLRFW